MTSLVRLPALAVVGFALALPSLSVAQEEQRAQPPAERQQEARRPRAEAESRLPPESVTRHTIELPGRTIKLTAIAGALALTNPEGVPQAEYGFVAYIRDDEDAASRPVTFAVNGGPGASSAYLNLLAIGPWRLPLAGSSISPSLPPVLQPNAETWLDFTDLVFIDPPGTGYGRVVGGDQVRERFYSVQGDIDGLSAFIVRWLKEKNRLRSPKFLAGESYGGFRGPLVAEKLQSDLGIGLSGLVLVSPVLDFDWIEQAFPCALGRCGPSALDGGCGARAARSGLAGRAAGCGALRVRRVSRRSPARRHRQAGGGPSRQAHQRIDRARSGIDAAACGSHRHADVPA